MKRLALGLLLFLVKPLARGEVSGNPVYGSAPEIWSEIFDLLNTESFTARKLSGGFRNLEGLERDVFEGKRKFFFTSEDFDETPVSITLKGESEWPLFLTTTAHMLREPAYSKLLKLAEMAVSKKTEAKEIDVLQKARFQNDLRTAISAIKLFRDEKSYYVEGVGDRKIELSNHLIKSLERVLATVLLTTAEIDALPDTDDLDYSKTLGEYGLDRRKYFRWKDISTIHEGAYLFAIHNQIYVQFSGRDAPLFEQSEIDKYITNSSRPRQGDYVFVLLDRLMVLDEARREHATKVTSLVRAARYGRLSKGPFGEKFARFDIRYFRRRAAIGNWKSAIEEPREDEPSAALVDLPNTPGFLKPFYETPIRVSCLQCHGERVVTFTLHNRDLSKRLPSNMYSGDKPPIIESK